MLRVSRTLAERVEATTATRPTDLEGSLSVLGSGGTVEIGGFTVNEIRVWEFEQKLPEDEEVKTNYSVNPPSVYGYGHEAFYRSVIESIKSEEPHLVEGPEGRRSLELITAIYESIETGRRVDLSSMRSRSKLGAKKSKSIKSI